MIGSKMTEPVPFANVLLITDPEDGPVIEQKRTE